MEERKLKQGVGLTLKLKKPYHAIQMFARKTKKPISALKDRSEKTIGGMKRVYVRLNDLTGGVLEIIRNTLLTFGKAHGAEAASSIAYYAFFSIFPLMLVLIVIGSFFLQRQVVQTEIFSAITQLIPNAQDVITINIERVLTLRAPVGFFALASLIWSSTSVFNAITLNLNRAFPEADIPNFFHRRMIALVMIFMLALLLILVLATTAASKVLPIFDFTINNRALQDTFLWKLFAFLIPLAVKFLMFWALYMWVPRVKVSRKSALIGGLVAAIAWEVVTSGFTYYLSSGLAQFHLVYGSVGAVVAMMFWIYLTAIITLMGAHLTAAIQRARHKTVVFQDVVE